jgi:hypothetical protein
MSRDSNNVLPELGMAAAAFACFLVIVSISSPSDQLRRAVAIFAVCIPIVVAGAFVSIIRRNADQNWIRSALMVLRLACIAVGDVGCGIGIYWVFAHVSATAARQFVTTAIICWFVIGLLDVAIRKLHLKNSAR